MSIIDTLVTDRKASDVSALRALNGMAWESMTAAQKAVWEAGRGAYNATDFNRVGEACIYLYETFTGMGYAVPEYKTPKTDWTMKDAPTVSDTEEYLSIVASLKAVLHTAQEIPYTMQNMTTEDANNIEKLLAEIDAAIGRIRRAWFYSGDLYAGEV